jgi:hypothetical protein
MADNRAAGLGVIVFTPLNGRGGGRRGAASWGRRRGVRVSRIVACGLSFGTTKFPGDLRNCLRRAGSKGFNLTPPKRDSTIIATDYFGVKIFSGRERNPGLARFVFHCSGSPNVPVNKESEKCD